MENSCFHKFLTVVNGQKFTKSKKTNKLALVVIDEVDTNLDTNLFCAYPSDYLTGLVHLLPVKKKIMVSATVTPDQKTHLQTYWNLEDIDVVPFKGQTEISLGRPVPL